MYVYVLATSLLEQLLLHIQLCMSSSDRHYAFYPLIQLSCCFGKSVGKSGGRSGGKKVGRSVGEYGRSVERPYPFTACSSGLWWLCRDNFSYSLRHHSL